MYYTVVDHYPPANELQKVTEKILHPHALQLSQMVCTKTVNHMLNIVTTMRPRALLPPHTLNVHDNMNSDRHPPI